jgi:hypothetical protein
MSFEDIPYEVLADSLLPLLDVQGPALNPPHPLSFSLF